MPDTDKIYSLDLHYNGTPMPFVIKTMEETDLGLGGISDIPHRYNYYTVIWSFTATGKHVIDFNFGLEWNTVLETGGLLVSDDVRINCVVDLVKQS